MKKSIDKIIKQKKGDKQYPHCTGKPPIPKKKTTRGSDINNIGLGAPTNQTPGYTKKKQQRGEKTYGLLNQKNQTPNYPWKNKKRDITIWGHPQAM